MSLLRMDLRHLPAPEPMQRILDELRWLRQGRRLVALTPYRPGPLLEILDAWGYVYRVQDLPAGQACVTICRGEEAEALAPPRVA